MAKLKYAIRDQKWRKIYGSSEASSKEELVRSLHAKGLVVVSVEEIKEALKEKRAGKRLHTKVKLEDTVIFATQMAVLLESGVTIIKSLDIISQQVESVTLLNVCRRIEEDIKSGSSLKEAVAKHPKVFSQLWVDLIETGEATGQLALVLRQLANYLEEVAEIKKKIISALTYPLVLVIVSIVAILVFMYRVIPIFAGIYKGITNELPFITKMVIDLSSGLQRNFLKGLIVVVVTVFVLRGYLVTEKGKRFFDGLKLRIPVLGDFFKSLAIERFTTSLAMLIKGGISIVHALEIAGRASSNKIVEDAVEVVKLNVIQGRPMSATLMQVEIFPPLVSQMIGVGEETGKLNQVLDQLAKFYGDDVSTKIARFVSLFEPMLLVIMGGVIGVLVVAMYLPIFKIASMAGSGGM